MTRTSFDLSGDETYDGYEIIEVTATETRLTVVYEGEELVGGWGQFKFGYEEKAGNHRIKEPFPDELTPPSELTEQESEETTRELYDTLVSLGIDCYNQ